MESNEFLAMRIIDLTNERDAALAQLVEVQDNRTGKAPCERFCEALAAKKMFDNLQSDNRQLRAQVEQLRQLGAELLNQCEGLGKSNAIWKATGKAFGNILYQDAAQNLAVCINSTPAQCLAEVKAQAVEGAINSVRYKYTYQHNAYKFFQEYANQLRQSAKAGE